MSQSRPTLSSPSRVPVVDGVRQIQRIAVRNAEVGAFRSTAHCQPGKAHRRCGAFSITPGRRYSAVTRPAWMWGRIRTSVCKRSRMIEGEVLHRDSLGSEQVIRPGSQSDDRRARIAHTEQSVGEPRRLHAAQLWIALPAEHADMAPRFDHYPDLPQWQNSGVNHRLLVGEFGAYRSPVFTLSPLIAIDMEWQEAATVQCRCAMTMKSASCP